MIDCPICLKRKIADDENCCWKCEQQLKQEASIKKFLKELNNKKEGEYKNV